METINFSLLTFLLNSLWQISLVAAVAALACWFLRRGPAIHRHAIWVAALLAAILLPLSSIRRTEPAETVELPASLALQPATGAILQANPAASLPKPQKASPAISLTNLTATILLGAYLLFLVYRLARLGQALLQTVRVRQGAQDRQLPFALEQVLNRARQAFNVDRVPLLFSPHLSGPVTACGAIILPDSILDEASGDVLTTAIGHEMAHVARRDFTFKIVYELLYLPVSFHPAAWMIRRGIECTREMACDEMVTQRLIDSGAYARSIMTIASAMTALPRPGYTLGVLDGDILEQRIRRLLDQSAVGLKRTRLLLAGSFTALAICAIVASSLSFTARAQGTAGEMLRQAQAAFDSGDYKTAAVNSEAATRLEPGNIKAKLLLGQSLTRQYVPGSDAASPLVTGARRQYLDVLEREPGNKLALHGMMLLLANARQFPESYQWAQKTIQSDSSDAVAYYTVGFLSWAMAFPDYQKARQAAGMKPPDPGIIPDAALRQSVRTQHLARIEDGERMLQTALQINPDYSDAMAYMNLLYRLQAGIVDSQAESDELIAKADDWVGKALAARKRQGPTAPVAGGLAAPPPPPPPPPPGRDGMVQRGAPPQRLPITETMAQGMLRKQTAPVYPAQARQDGITGTVRLNVVIAKDGTVHNLQVVSGPPPLVAAALQAVRQWEYQPVLLIGNPVEVTTTLRVNFTP